MAQTLRLRPIMFRAIGIVLVVAGYLILLLPGPLGWPGIPPLVLGALLILKSSRGARRWFVQAARQQPKTFGRLRRWIAQRRADRWRKRPALRTNERRHDENSAPSPR